MFKTSIKNARVLDLGPHGTAYEFEFTAGGGRRIVRDHRGFFVAFVAVTGDAYIPAPEIRGQAALAYEAELIESISLLG